MANYCHIKPSTVTSLLGSKEKKGLIVRLQNPDDRRIYNVNLAEVGREKFAEIENINDKMEKLCFKGFSKEEKEKIFDFLECIADNMIRLEEENV